VNIQNAMIQLTFNVPLNTTTISSSTVVVNQGTVVVPTIITYDGSRFLVTVMPTGQLQTATSYTVTVTTALADTKGSTLTSPFSFSFTTQSPSSLSGQVVPPVGIDPTTMTVVGLYGSQTNPANDGSFSVVVRPSVASIVGVAVAGSQFGMLAATADGTTQNNTATFQRSGVQVHFHRHQITASPNAQTSSNDLVVDFQTTAETLLFVSPVLFHSDPQKARTIMAAVAADPLTQQLALALKAAAGEQQPLDDPNVRPAFIAALKSILSTLQQSSQPATAAVSRSETQHFVGPAPHDTSASSSLIATLTPYDICCITIPPFTLNNGSFVSNAEVQPFNGPGWLLRTGAIDPALISQINPPSDPNGGFDSPGNVQECSSCPGPFYQWFPGNPGFQYLDIEQAIDKLSDDFFGTLPGFTNISPSISVPNQSGAYLLRFYSGGAAIEGDGSDGQQLIATLPKGPELWSRALAANFTIMTVDVINATGLVPENVNLCLVSDLGSDGLITGLTTPGSPTQVQFSWDGFLNVSKAIAVDYENNFLSCFGKNLIRNFLEEFARTAEWSDGIDILQVLTNAGEAVQIFEQLSLKDPAVNTALLVVAPSTQQTGPTSHFTMSAAGQTSTDGRTLNLTVSTNGNVAVSFDSTSIQGSTAIVHWLWKSNGTQICNDSPTCNVNFGTASNTITLIVTDANGLNSTATGQINLSFTSGQGPTTTGISPPAVAGSTNSFSLTINGNNFDPSVSLIVVTGPGCSPCTVPNNVLTTKTSSQIIGPVTIFNAGSYSIAIQNGLGGPISNGQTLTVSAPATSSISPTSVTASPNSFSLTINGNNFDPSGAIIVVTGPGCSPCTVPNNVLTTRTSTQIVGPVTINNAANYTIAIQNGVNGPVSNGQTLTVTSGTVTTSSISPNSVPASTNSFSLTINGNNFDPTSALIVVTGPGCSPCTVPNNVLTTKTSSQIIGPITIFNAGSYSIAIQNGLGGPISNGQTLTVSAPVTSSISPTSVTASPNSFSLTINGNNFDPSGAIIVVTGPGCSPCTVPNNVLTTRTSTQIVGPVTINNAANYTIAIQNGVNGPVSNGQVLTVH
jgi:hypothetical protein